MTLLTFCKVSAAANPNVASEKSTCAAIATLYSPLRATDALTEPTNARDVPRRMRADRARARARSRTV